MKRNVLSARFICISILLFTFILMVIRNAYTFSWTDESLYLSTVHRLWIGERMFVDEWYTSQLSAPILLPFYCIYNWICGSNEGVFLFFRNLYSFLALITSIYTFVVLSKHNNAFLSCISSLLFLLFSRANINGMSYYNLTLLFILLACVLIYDQRMKGSFSYTRSFICGIFIALSIVCTPYIIVLYGVLFIALLIVPTTRKYYKYMVMCLLGNVSAALIYMSYILSKIRVTDIIENIPHILNEPDLQSTNPLLAIPLIIARTAYQFKYTIIISFIICFYCLVHIRKRNSLSKQAYIILSIVNIVIYIANFITSFSILGLIYISLLIYVLTNYCIASSYDNDICIKNSAIPYEFLISGVILCIAFALSSDTGTDAMCIGYVLIALVFVIVSRDLLCVLGKRNYALILILIISVLQLGLLRLLSVYRDVPLERANTEITYGPAKGLYTAKEHIKWYDDINHDISAYVRPNDQVLYAQICGWAYMCTNNAYGTYSEWRVPISSPRLEEYYTARPDKIATCVFVLKEEYGTYQSSIIQNGDYSNSPNRNFMEGYFYEYLESENYEKIECASGLIYRLR